LLKKYGAFSEMVTKKYTYQILRGLEYLHAHQIMHRDIKGANVLADDHGLCKLADFGASVLIENEDQHKSLAGTPFWMAPEIIKQNGHGRQADIWSVGCTGTLCFVSSCSVLCLSSDLRFFHAVLEMLSGQVPWSSFGSSVSVMYKIANTEELPPMPATISPEARDLILKCLQRDPRQRPNAVTLLQHPFLAGVAELMQVKSGSLSRASRMPLDDALIAEAGANVQAARFAAQQQELQMLKQQHQQQQLQFQLQQQQHQQQLQNLNAGSGNNTGSQRPKGLLAGGTGLVTGSSGAVTGSAVAFANVFPQFSGISNPNTTPQPSQAPLVGILAAANTGLATPSSANPSGNAGTAAPAGVDFQSIPGLTPDMARALQMASTTPNGVAPELLAAALAGGSVVTMSSPFRARREQMRQRGTLGVVSSGVLNSNVPLATGDDPSSMPAGYSAGLPSGGNSVPLSGGSLGRAGGAAAAAMHGRTTPPESGNDGGEVMYDKFSF
jgi:serine/threonine protein kinase